MFAHQVIDYLNGVSPRLQRNKVFIRDFDGVHGNHQMQKIIKKGGETLSTVVEVIESLVDSLLPYLKKAQCFHLGKMESVLKLETMGNVMFCEDFNTMRLPYDTVWFDYYKDYETKDSGYTKETKSLEFASSKRGILVKEIELGVWFISMFNYIDMEKTWDIGGQYMALIGDRAKAGDHQYIHMKNTDFIKYQDNLKHCRHAGHIVQLSYLTEEAFPNSGFPNSRELMWQDQGDLTVLSAAVKLLNCKNVTTEQCIPSEKLNKKRIKNNKHPLFSYHLLVLKPTTQYEKSIPQHLWENRVHLCRGHFKTYTEENKLFGRLTGRYWWQPQARGNKKLGVVMKDYVVKQAV